MQAEDPHVKNSNCCGAEHCELLQATIKSGKK